ncbi:MAG: sensor histidine kinase [Burkholderiales bacterium]|nr:sensor histidine kinase [Burkholderiales bacterium]
MLWVGSVWLACVLGATWYVDREINHNFDSEMVESAHRMIEIAVHDLDQASAAGPLEPARLPLVAHEPVIDDDPVVFQLADATPRMLMRSPEAPATAFAVPLAIGFAETGPWRVYTVKHPTRPLYLHLADPLAERHAARNGALLGLFIPLMAVLPLLALMLRRIARRELRVVSELESEIARRSGSDLSRISLDALPAELQSVGEHVNRLLGRLERALDTERSLAANAAHELRTPLAAVRLRLQTALDENLSRADVQAALDALATFGHRADKLLQLSRAESSDALARQPVDLVQLAATVAEEFWGAEPARRRLDLQIAESGLLPARGDVDSLAIALRNLVENALRYSGDARVAIEVLAPCTLVVRDEGPGVAASTLETLRRRHVRQTADATGYGLGLSIVGTIAEKQEGRLDLSSPPPGRGHGFEARLTLQPAPTAPERAAGAEGAMPPAEAEAAK